MHQVDWVSCCHSKQKCNRYHLGPLYEHSAFFFKFSKHGMDAWINHFMHIFVGNIDSPLPWTQRRSSETFPPLHLAHGWVITSKRKLWTPLLIHRLNSLMVSWIVVNKRILRSCHDQHRVSIFIAAYLSKPRYFKRLKCCILFPISILVLISIVSVLMWYKALNKKNKALLWLISSPRFYNVLVSNLWFSNKIVTYICICKLTIIGPDNSLSPGRRQAIIWTNAGIVLSRILGTNF